MISPDSETRRATGSWTFTGAAGHGASGEGQLVIGDDALSAGPQTVAYLDADELATVDRTIALTLHPAGRLTLSMLGRRHDTFAATLREAWLARRVAGMLAHGIDAPVRFRGVTTESELADADFLLFSTHVTVAPDRSDPWQLPLGAIGAVRHNPKDWTIDVDAWGRVVRFGQLARRTDEFARALAEAVARSRAALGAERESTLFADGTGVPASGLADFASLVERWAAPERLEGARAIVQMASDPRIGLVRIVDTDDALLAAREPLPANIAAFVLAAIGSRVVLEVISGPSAATYVFEGDIEAINRDLQLLHFRRQPLRISESELASPASDYRLCARRLEPLRRLRAATRERIVHDESHAQKIAGVLRR